MHFTVVDLLIEMCQRFYLEDALSPRSLNLWLGELPQVGLLHTPPSHQAPSAQCSKCNSVWCCRSRLGSFHWHGDQGGLSHFETRTQTLPPGRNSPRHSKESEECCWSPTAGQKVQQKGGLKRQRQCNILSYLWCSWIKPWRKYIILLCVTFPCICNIFTHTTYMCLLWQISKALK